MPAFGWQLDDAEVAAVLTYVRNSWGAAAPAVQADAVRRARQALASRSD
jgi:mono/diheme cytochrome c family protein